MKNLTRLKQTITLSFISSTALFTPLTSQALTVEKVMPNSKMLATDIVETFHGTSLHKYRDNSAWVRDSFSDRNQPKLNSIDNIIEAKITPQYKSSNYNRGTFDPTTPTTGIFDFDSSNSNNNNSNNHSLGKISLLLITIGAIMLCLAEAIKWLQRREGKIFINPQISNKNLNRSDSREIYCAKCRQPMTIVKLIQLSKPQQVAKKLGSVTFKGYKCSSCSDRNLYSLISYLSNSSRYQVCPDCNELTATRTETRLKKATYYKKGKVLISDRCFCCDYCQEKTIDTPRLRPPSSGGGSGSSGNSSDYYVGGMAGVYSSSSSDGGSGSSGGDFGGGSSGGDGAGGSF
jgi:uncharacterized protein